MELKALGARELLVPDQMFGLFFSARTTGGLRGAQVMTAEVSLCAVPLH